jgi:glycyl-tRNA synthetase
MEPKNNENQNLEENTKFSIDDVAVFCKKKGFVYQNSEIYGGMAGFFDYGPLGVELKNNLKQEWWKKHVTVREDVVGIDGSIIAHPKVWVASGHVGCFADLMLTCTKCKEKIRADTYLEEVLKIQADGIKAEEVNKLVKENDIKCPKCKSEFGETKDFNLMFSTNVAGFSDGLGLISASPQSLPNSP